MSRQSTTLRDSLRATVAHVLAAVLLAVSGCATSPQLSAAEASATTNEIADATVATIDTAAIAETEVKIDDSRQCGGTDVDPDGSIRQWIVNRHLLLAEGLTSADATAASLAALEAAGWEAGFASTAPDAGARHRLTNPAHEGYTLSLTEAGPSIDPPVVIVQVTSPCGEFVD